MSDWELVQLYRNSGSEEAFAELVGRHLGWVYSVALRHVHQTQLAEEVAQSVFVLLARKAGGFRAGTVLGGWLFRTTCFVASRAQRAEQRLKKREQVASSMMPALSFPEENQAVWEQLAPQLDKAVAALPESDRAAILLRFYEKKGLREIGERLGISEDTAKKRVGRAVGRLRGFLAKRGVAVGSTLLVTILGERVVEAAPATLQASVLQGAVAAAPAGALLPHLVRETLSAWRWARIKLIGGLAVGSLAVVLLTMNAVGLLGSHAPPPPFPGSASPIAETVRLPAEQGRDARGVPPVKPPSRARQKNGMLMGLVVDQSGRPIAGAQVWGGFCQNPFAVDTTDASGQFALDKAAAPPFVTVTADGFAADQQQFDLTNTSGSFVFRLSPVPSLDVRLVDEAGQGVSGAWLFLANWWGRVGTLGQRLPQVSTSDGWLKWLSPPRGELELQFGKAAYRYSRTNKFAADGQAHVIVLHPAGTLIGNVFDSETGAPVMSFQFTPGHAQPWVPSDPTPLWELHSEPGNNGVFKMALDEEQTPYVRIQAEGYETIEFQIQTTNGLEVVRDFRLRRQSPAHSIRGRVLLPDGTPAAAVQVALCTVYVGVMLNGASLAPEPFGDVRGSKADDYRRITDDQGAFSFAPMPGAHTVVAVGPAGLGQTRCLDISKPLEIRLQVWGRIEGTVRTRDGQWGNRKVSWSHPGNLTRWMTLFYGTKGFSALSDASGNFTLEHVPPGDCRVAVEDDAGGAPVLSTLLRVNPDQTVHLQVGGVGRPVVGRLVAPSGVEIRSWPDQVTSSELHTAWDDYHVPEGLDANATERWKLEFEDTDSGRAWFRDQYSYNFRVAADGSFSIPEVLPGKYRLFVNVGQGYLGSGQGSSPSLSRDPRIAATGIEVIVPDDRASSSPLDLGDVVLVADH